MKKLLLTASFCLLNGTMCAMQDSAENILAPASLTQEENSATQTVQAVFSAPVVTEPNDSEQVTVQAPVQETSHDSVLSPATQTEQETIVVQEAPVVQEQVQQVAEVAVPVNPAQPAVTLIPAALSQWEALTQQLKNPTAQKVEMTVIAAIAAEEILRRLLGMGSCASTLLGVSVASLVVSFPELRVWASQLLEKYAQKEKAPSVGDNK
ncbi:hypothetical protein CVU75_02925 [Candidatus Dependentiae bacterium HGW-Dependentiae-1]|nr:MAG: hypothetical protein CVU75_02925 [Candidatus Dependentiae bacterium HGW-Dependentiae-1]